MKEQEMDGDLPAIAAAMQIIGASYVETLDTKGTDGSNIHLGGPATITGYFGGIGEPNHYALKWLEEFLYYYTNYGVRQVLNVQPRDSFTRLPYLPPGSRYSRLKYPSSWATIIHTQVFGRCLELSYSHTMMALLH